MAITVKSMSGIDALKKLKVAEPFINWLKGSGVSVVIKADGIHFKVPPLPVIGDGFGAHLAMQPSQVIALNANKLGEPTFTTLQSKAMNLISSLKSQFGDHLAALSDDDIMEAEKASTTPEASTLAKLPPLGFIAPAAAKEEIAAVAAKPAWPDFPTDKMQTAKAIKLRDATMMYQPVEGTSQGSRYFVVGANANVRIAARWSGSSLSVRIEGPGLSKVKNACESVGFNVSQGSKGDYASIHLNCQNDADLAAKTLGAVLLGLGLSLETPLPDFKRIK